MAVFTYSALKKDGSMATGEMTATDRSDAFRRLDRNGMQPLSLKEKDGAAAAAPDKKAGKEKPNGKEMLALKDAKPAKEEKPSKEERKAKEALVKAGKNGSKDAAIASKDGGKDAAVPGPVKLKKADIIIFTEELSDLLAAGLQLEPALRIMESRDELSAVKDVTVILRNRIRDGASFSSSLKAASPTFGELYCNLAAAGEISGALPKILRRQAEYLTSVAALQAKVTTAMIYPICLIVAGLAVTILFVSYLIPQLTVLLKSMNKELPVAAKWLMNIGDWALSYWWLIAFVIGVSVWAFQKITSSETYRPKWDQKKVTMTFFGPLQSARFFVQFLETLSNLLGNGLPLLRALELTRDATPNRYLKGLLGKVISMVGEGGSLSRSLKKVGFFPSLLTDMITVGEQTGDLEHALERTARRYDKELQKTIDRGMALITPVIILIMAVVVGTMAYMMVSIIIQSVNSVKR
ncbi:MAG TPA: type II secretion system F family protein [Verrucomicrobiales bacterium]|nr:type II secretion system F family protein [Verrucomicrobiales bacterium]